MSVRKVMRLKPRNGQPETSQDIGGFKAEGSGYRVKCVKGKDIGYFGPDKYESIVFEVWFEEHRVA